MNKTLLFFTVFCFGYFFSDVLKLFEINPIVKVEARIDGKDAYELYSDYDFKRAVAEIVENCSPNRNRIVCPKD